ncbi:MAG: OmpH family outer membrane protein [Prevotella sp.]|nr:OmpH family outer membrane protein [Prevotella sp.]
MKKLFMMLMLCAPLSLFAQQKFGHVDLDKVIQSLPEYTTAMQELEALGKQYEQELTASQTELQRLAEEYDKTKSTLSATQQQEKEADLQEKYQRITEQAQQNQQAFQRAQQEKMAPIQQRVMQAVEAVGKAGGYVYIMSNGSLPYINDSISKDVTSDVKAQLAKK